MKKNLLILLIFSTILTASYAQTALKFYKDDAEVTERVLRVTSNDPSVDVMIEELDVVNVTDTNLMVYCTRRVLQTAGQGTSNYFCWGSCFTSSVDTSLDAVLLKPLLKGDGVFSGDYTPYGVTGVTKIKYIFFHRHKIDSTRYVDIFLDEMTLEFEITDAVKTSEKIVAVAPFPTPASTFVKSSLNIPSKGDAKVVLRNMLGVVVTSQNVLQQGEVITDVSSVPNGVYIYSVVVAGRPVYSKKIIVSH